jgi:hypothetical protein
VNNPDESENDHQKKFLTRTNLKNDVTFEKYQPSYQLKEFFEFILLNTFY